MAPAIVTRAQPHHTNASPARVLWRFQLKVADRSLPWCAFKRHIPAIEIDVHQLWQRQVFIGSQPWKSQNCFVVRSSKARSSPVCPLSWLQKTGSGACLVRHLSCLLGIQKPCSKIRGMFRWAVTVPSDQAWFMDGLLANVMIIQPCRGKVMAAGQTTGSPAHMRKPVAERKNPLGACR